MTSSMPPLLDACRRSTLVVALLAAFAIVQRGQTEPPARDVFDRLLAAERQHSELMPVFGHLTDVYGPRLTGSPNYKRAGEYARATLVEWGLSEVHVEPFGPFGPGWVLEHVSLNVLSPDTYPIEGYPPAWTPGTSGPVTAAVVHATIDSERDFETYRGALKRRFVLLGPVESIADRVEAGRRFTDAELDAMSGDGTLPPALIRLFPPISPPPPPAAQEAQRRQAEFRAKRMQFLLREGALAILQPAGGGNGILAVQMPAQGEGSPVARAPVFPYNSLVKPFGTSDLSPLPQIALAAEHFNRIARTLDEGVAVTLEADVRAKFVDDSSAVFNIVADLPGTDKRDEIVMIGGHFDSWHTGTGATDNGINAAATMEAIRLLKVSGLPLRRTIRLGLWAGEEQGLLGSKAYVAAHFGSPDALKPDATKVSVYFNADQGGGAIRGLFIQSNDTCAPIVRRWIAPLVDLGVTAIVTRNVNGTDHESFNAIGIPGFFFIQDPLDYRTRSHHTNLDVYERVSAETVQRNAALIAYFAYQAANREDLLPRRSPTSR